MEVIINDKYETKCPFCGSKGDDNDVLQFTDYVDYPMIWCWDCDSRAVLDNRYFSGEGDEIKEDRKVPLLFIERLSDSIMIETMYAEKLSDEEVNMLLDKQKINKEPIDNLHIKLKEKRKHIKKYVMNYSVPVESYNAHRPKIPYHKNVDLYHGGCEIYLQVKQENISKIIKYWGD